MVTYAMPSGLRSRVPAKITSSMRLPRRLLADCSPSTQLMASLRLDLPHPLGPTMAAIPSPLKRSSVRSQKDLNPCNPTLFIFSKPCHPRLRLGGVVTILTAPPQKVKHLPYSPLWPGDPDHKILWAVYPSTGGKTAGASNDGHC